MYLSRRLPKCRLKGGAYLPRRVPNADGKALLDAVEAAVMAVEGMGAVEGVEAIKAVEGTANAEGADGHYSRAAGRLWQGRLWQGTEQLIHTGMGHMAWYHCS